MVMLLHVILAFLPRIMYFMCVWWKRCGSNFTYNTVYSSCTMSCFTVQHSHNCNPKHLFKLPNRVSFACFPLSHLVHVSTHYDTTSSCSILQSTEQYCKMKTLTRRLSGTSFRIQLVLSALIPYFSSTFNILYHIISLAQFFYKKSKITT